MTDHKQRLERRRRKIRLAIIGLSVGAGLLCGYLPEQYQALCKLAAKLAALFGGG
jgi:predicted alpha/beta-fold hydrolase